MSYENIHEPSFEYADYVKQLYASVLRPEKQKNVLERALRCAEGGIDTHVHAAPDATMWTWQNEIETAMSACELGLQAIVFKSLSGPSTRTTALAQWVLDRWAKERGIKSIKVLGGVVLDRNVGGLNPEAVEFTARLGGKFVWTPILDSSHHRKLTGQNSGIEVVDKNDKVVPALYEIFELVAKYDLVLALGHHSVKERFIMIDAAKEAGVKRINLVHVFQTTTRMTFEQMKIAAKKGTYLEQCCARFRPPSFVIEERVAAIKEVGVDHFVIGTDAGNWTMPPQASQYKTFLAYLLTQNVSEADIIKIAKTNAKNLIF